MQNLADSQLIDEIKEGSHRAFEVLVKKYNRYFYAIAYRYVADRDTAEELTQQAFLKLWEYPYKYNASKGAGFKTWFSQVMVNLCIDYKRKNKHFFEDIEDAEIESGEKDISTKLYDKEVKVLLEKAISKLPFSQQSALNLGIYQNIPYEEVAKIMKTTTSSVKSLIMRAKENIKKQMKGKINVE